MSIRAQAVITLTLEVQTSSVWGEDCSLGQVAQQATEEAVNRLNKLIKSESGIRLKGVLVVQSIITEQ